VNTEERQLAEMLHQVTPEPPRGVTVEDVALRLASGPGRARGGDREPRARRGRSAIWRRGWAPVLAAASVFVVAGATAGIATVMTSHHSASSSETVTITGSASPASPSTPAQSPSPAQSAGQTTPITAGPWNARLIDRQALLPGSLAGGGDSLYAFTGTDLVRIDPASGDVVRAVRFSSPVENQPVILGNTVWVVWAYNGGNVVLRGYDAQTLTQVASLPVPAIGRVSSAASGVLTAGPDGHLYLAAGDTVAVVDPATGHLIRRIYLTDGAASSVAVSPDGSKLYVGLAASNSFRLLTYDLASAVQTESSRMTSGGVGNLVATSGGVWGTDGSGMSEWVWFAPGGDLSRSSRVTQGAGGGLYSLPVVADGTVWIGGTHTLACADPGTGKVRASAAIPADHSSVEYFGSVTYAGGHAYSYYLDAGAQQSGVASLTPPAACSG
jgi:hypothetical protein